MKEFSATLYVFVYGTLKPGERNYRSHCEGKVISAIASYTWGKLYNLPVGYPAMTAGKSKVRGFLLSFADSKILKSLDRLEGYEENRAFQLNEYYRQQVPVYSLENKFLGKAWGYLMSEKKVTKYDGVYLNSGAWTRQDMSSFGGKDDTP